LFAKPPADDPVGEDMDAFVSSARSAGAIQPGGPWLGIQFGPVPKPLAAHLGLEPGTGQMVLNIVEGSPADIAGMQQYDVITQIDSRPVVGEVESFIDILRTFAPGETRMLNVVRGSKPIQANLVIGARPEDAEITKYKY
jgi:serine protease Do